MTYRTNYELTTRSIPAWRRFGLWLNPQRWWFARKARGGHWVLYRSEVKNLPGHDDYWTREERCTGGNVTWAHSMISDKGGIWWNPIAHEDHGEVWG